MLRRNHLSADDLGMMSVRQSAGDDDDDAKVQLLALVRVFCRVLLGAVGRVHLTLRTPLERHSPIVFGLENSTEYSLCSIKSVTILLKFKCIYLLDSVYIYLNFNNVETL
jgi:hypothetical protein